MIDQTIQQQEEKNNKTNITQSQHKAQASRYKYININNYIII